MEGLSLLKIDAIDGCVYIKSRLINIIEIIINLTIIRIVIIQIMGIDIPSATMFLLGVGLFESHIILLCSIAEQVGVHLKSDLLVGGLGDLWQQWSLWQLTQECQRLHAAIRSSCGHQPTLHQTCHCRVPPDEANGAHRNRWSFPMAVINP